MYSRLKHVFLVDYSGNLRLKFKSSKLYEIKWRIMPKLLVEEDYFD